MSTEYEIRVGYYGGLVLTSEMIEAQRFKLEMEQHRRQQQEDQDLLIYAMKLKAASFKIWNPFKWFGIYIKGGSR